MCCLNCFAKLLWLQLLLLSHSGMCHVDPEKKEGERVEVGWGWDGV